MTTELATILGSGGAGAVLATAVGYAIKRAADAWRSRSKTADNLATKRAESDAATAKSAAERAETESAAEYIAAETMRDLVASVNRAVETSEKREAASMEREARCQVDLERERQARIADLAEERRQRRADLDAAKTECEDRIRELDQRLRGTVERVDSLSPPLGTPRYRVK